MIYNNFTSLTISGASYTADLSDIVEEYYITGTSVLTSDWSFTFVGVPVETMRCRIIYNATTTLGAFHLYFFGVQMPDVLANKDFNVEVLYLNAAWHVTFQVDAQDTSIIETNDLVDDCVTNDKLANMTRGTVKVGGLLDAPTDLTANVAGNILVGNGTDILSVAMSGDGTLSGAGALTIAADAIDNTKLNNMTRGTVKVGGVANAPTDLVASTNAQILIGNGIDLISVPMTGDVTITNAGVTTVNPAILGANLWEAGSAGTHSVRRINADTGCDATADYSFAIGHNSTATGASSIVFGTSCWASGTNSISGGLNSSSLGTYSISIGNSCVATNAGCVAFGNNSVSSSNCSVSMGEDCIASGDNSVAIGYIAHATGDYSGSIGFNTIASGDGSIAICFNTEASGHHSFASGYSSKSHLDSSKSFASGMFIQKGDAQKIDTILKIATTNAVADYMQLADGTDGITIPTDCTADIDIRIVAVQTGGAAGTVGDSFRQNIKLCAKNIAGVSSVVTHNGATLANYSVVAGDVLYELSSCDAAFAGTVTASVAANKLQIQVTGENNKDIQWVAYVSFVWTGYRNFSI